MPRHGAGRRDLQAPRSRTQLFLRNTVMKLMGIPFVAELAMGRSLRDAIELPAFPSA